MEAIYAGSFDPFTKGHKEVILKASNIFNKIHIIFAENTMKSRRYNLDGMMEAVQTDLDNLSLPTNFIIKSTNGLIADYAKETGVFYLIRGLRDTTDYLYEEKIAKINKEIFPSLETIYFRTDSIISSSMVRELSNHGKNISKYVDENVQRMMISNDNKY